MRSPNDARFQKIQQLHASGMMVGLDRPVTRVTWAKQSIIQLSTTRPTTVRWLQQNVTEHEFTGIRQVSIQRSIGQDAATCTIDMWNVSDQTMRPSGIDTEGTVGTYSPGRGETIPQMTSVFSQFADPIMVNGNSQLITFPTDWGYGFHAVGEDTQVKTINPYRDVFIPNTVLRTYQGYGSDNFDTNGNEIWMQDGTSAHYVAPKDDTKLYLTGVWLIDQVTYGADGSMQVECRDLAKLLIEQYIFPPLLPMDRFPLIYCPAHKATGHKESNGKNVATFHSSSVDAKFGHNAPIFGHRGSDAFDNKAGSFWLSGGNNSRNDLAWLQAKVHGPVNEVVLDMYQGNYIVYVSLHAEGKWQGTNHTDVAGNVENLTYADSPGSGQGFQYVITSGDTLWDLAYTYYGDHLKWPIIAQANNNIIIDPHWIYPGQRIKIPYVPGTNFPPPAGGDATGGTRTEITYVCRATIPSSGKVTIRLPRTYNADYVRVVFSQLNEIQGAYRAGVRTMIVRHHLKDTYKPSTINKPGFIQDWSEPIKEMLAWAGFAYPGRSSADPLLGHWKNPGQDRLTKYGAANTNLGVWGDFETLGAGPVVCTPGDYFSAKSFMDGIRQIVDFIGGIFFIDETGGAQFRLPNVWSGGNFFDDPSAARSLAGPSTEHPIELHENANLLSYQVVISDANVRSEIYVVGTQPNVKAKGYVAGGYVLGYNSATKQTSAIDFTDVLAGQYRLMSVPPDSTALFYTDIECQRMAELTALFILFTYRQGNATIPAHPGLQVDDQVRIFERVTYETNIHYVSGISSTHDLEQGKYTMDLTTHWLGQPGGNTTGTGPDTTWFVNKATLTPAVLRLPAIAKRAGKEASGDNLGESQTLPITNTP